MFMRNLVALSLLSFTAFAVGGNLPDLSSFSIRGSYAFTDKQLALELFNSLPADPSDMKRSNGYITCVQQGHSYLAYVECKIDGHNPSNRKYLSAKIELIDRPFTGFSVESSSPEFFSGLKKEQSDWIRCEDGEKSVCRFRVK